MTPLTRSSVAGSRSLAQVRRRPLVALSPDPVPGRPTLSSATVCDGLTSTLIVAGELVVARDALLQVGDRRLHLRGVDVARLHHDGGGSGLGRERGLDLVVRLDRLQVLRQVLGARQLRLHAERGDRQGDQEAAGEHDRHDRTAHHAVDQPAPDA